MLIFGFYLGCAFVSGSTATAVTESVKVCESQRSSHTTERPRNISIDLGGKALLASLLPEESNSISWGGTHPAKLILYHQASRERFLPAGWVEDLAEASKLESTHHNLSLNEDPISTDSTDSTAIASTSDSIDTQSGGSESSTSTESLSTSPTPDPITSTSTSTTTSSSTTTPTSSTSSSSTRKHNVAGDGFEFPSDRLDPRKAIYNGPNGLNRSNNGWRQYWTDPRDQSQVRSDFLEWAKSAANIENTWLQKFYADAIGQRILRNTKAAQKFERTVSTEPTTTDPQSWMLPTKEASHPNLNNPEISSHPENSLRDQDARYFQRITYKGKSYSQEQIIRARHGTPPEIAKKLSATLHKNPPTTPKPAIQAVVAADPPDRKLSGHYDDTNDFFLPKIKPSFTPPAWLSSSRTIPDKQRGESVRRVKRWDSAPIEKSPKDVNQVRENVVAIQERPFYGLQKSDRDYFGKDSAEEINLMRPWDRLWSPKKLPSS